MNGRHRPVRHDESIPAGQRDASQHHAHLRAHFERLSALDGAAREAALTELRARDGALAEELRELLSHHDEAALLDHSLAGVASSLGAAAEAVPVRIGSYEVVRELGRGGMGVVYEARQEFPKRSVALKVLRPEFASTSLSRRFAHEADALAKLQHPGIASLYEAGVDTSRGLARAFLAMELVRGETLAEYAQRATLRERLALMAKVCDAVQHAHERGVIHRDIKPGNILVTHAGEPKVLDFGIARMADAGAAQTVRTSAGQILGTFAYMSPEQVEADPSKIDARCDVYALGAVLHEMASGKRAFELGGMSVAQAVSAIRSHEPTLLGSVDASLRGDVEAIVAKAMEKEPALRYQSAGELAADIRRHLQDEPVLARPQTTWYQARKFARRNTLLVGVVAGAFVVLCGALGVTAWQAVAASRARDDATAQAKIAQAEAKSANAVTQFFVDVLHQGHAEIGKGEAVTVQQVVKDSAPEVEKRFADDPSVRYKLHAVLGSVFLSLGDLERAVQQYDKHVALTREVNPNDPAEWVDAAASLGDALGDKDELERAEQVLREAWTLAKEKVGADAEVTAKVETHLGSVLVKMGKESDAVPIFEHAIAVRERLLGKNSRETLVAVNGLAIAYQNMGDLEKAEPLVRRNAEETVKNLGRDHPDGIAARANISRHLMMMGKAAEAVPILEETLADARRVLGEAHYNTLATRVGLATALMDLKRNDEAASHLEAAIEGYKATVGADHIDCLLAMNNLTVVYEQSEKLSDAQRVGDELLAVMERREATSMRTIITMSNVGRIHCKAGDWAGGEERLRRAVAAAEGALPPGHAMLGRTHATLGFALLGLGKSTEADAEFEEAFKLASAAEQGNASAKLIADFCKRAGDTKRAEAWRAKMTPPAEKPAEGSGVSAPAAPGK